MADVGIIYGSTTGNTTGGYRPGSTARGGGFDGVQPANYSGPTSSDGYPSTYR